MSEDTERRRNTLVEDLRRQLKKEFLAGFEEGCKAASLVRCKDCRYFAEVTPNSYQKSIRVCIKGHNGFETFGCTEGEPRNVQD